MENKYKVIEVYKITVKFMGYSVEKTVSLYEEK